MKRFRAFDIGVLTAFGATAQQHDQCLSVFGRGDASGLNDAVS